MADHDGLGAVEGAWICLLYTSAEEAAQPVPAPAVSQPVPAVPEAEPVYEEPSVPEPVPAVSRTADPIPEEEPEDRQPAYIEEPENAAYEPEPEMDEDAGPEPEEDPENTQEMNARLEEERLEKEIRSMSREEKQLFASFVPVSYTHLWPYFGGKFLVLHTNIPSLVLNTSFPCTTLTPLSLS